MLLMKCLSRARLSFCGYIKDYKTPCELVIAGTRIKNVNENEIRDVINTNNYVNDELVMKIIEMRGKYRNLFTGRRNASRAGWRKIIHELDMADCLTVERLKKKWSNLVQKYKELRNSKVSKTTEDGIDLPMNWPFYDAMDELVGDQPTIAQVKLSPPSILNKMLLNSTVEKESSNVAQTPTASTSETVHTLSESPELPRAKRRKKRNETDPLLQIVQDTLRRLEEHHNHIEKQNDRLFNLLETFIASSKK